MLRKYLRRINIILVVLLCSVITLNAQGKKINTAILKQGIKVQHVPLICQYPELPTGCEATALTMLLRHSGVKVTKQQVADALPKVKLPYYQKGIKKGKHPNEGFVGTPYSGSSYGVYAKPVMQVLEKYLPNRAENLCGQSFEELLEVVKQGRPVMIWATINMINVQYNQSWQLENGQTYWWPDNEHAVIVVGYDNKYIYINDPYSGRQKKYSKVVVMHRYESLGKQAVAVLPEAERVDLQVNNQTLEMDENRLVISVNKEIFIPINYLNKLGINANYFYSDKMCVLSLPNIEESLNLKEGKTITVATLSNQKKVNVKYEIRDGITRISLNSLCQIYSFNYKLNKSTVNIEL